MKKTVDIQSTSHLLLLSFFLLTAACTPQAVTEEQTLSERTAAGNVPALSSGGVPVDAAASSINQLDESDSDEIDIEPALEEDVQLDIASQDFIPDENAKLADTEVREAELEDTSVTDLNDAEEPANEVLEAEATVVALEELDAKDEAEEKADSKEKIESKRKNEKSEEAQKHRIFVTSDRYNGSLRDDFDDQHFKTGLEGADYRCQWHAQKNKLGGTWQALLGDSSESVHDRVVIAGPVVTTIAGVIAESSEQFWSAKLNYAVNFDERGKQVLKNYHVWTGMSHSGKSVADFNCNDWTSDSKHVKARIGKAGETGESWIAKSKAAAKCHRKLRLYCVEQFD